MRLKILPLSTEYGLCCGCSFNFLKPNEQHLIGSHCKSGSGNSCRLFTDKKVDIRVLEILLTIDPPVVRAGGGCVLKSELVS